jgi:ubiquinone/menaquinone biosynthesis C-methylase UbiE
MESEDIVNQYNFIGKDYIEGQSLFFNEKEDWGRNKIDEFSSGFLNKVIIDAGCGYGVDTTRYLEGGALKILSFDPSEYMLGEAKQRVLSKTVDFKIGKYEKIPYEDDCCDLLIGRFSLHYVSELDLAYKEIFRVMKSGGQIIFLLPHPYDDFSRTINQNNEKNTVSISLYNGKVTVSYPPHTFLNYFSEYFLQHFTLDGFSEFTPDEMGKKDFPTAFIFSATKK